MAAYNVAPGDKAVIINSSSGDKGLSVGRKVLVHANAPDPGDYDQAYCDNYNSLNDPQHYCPPSPYEKEHTLLGKIWPVTSLDGKPFTNENGAVVKFTDVPDRWLRKLLPAEAGGISDTVKRGLPVTG